MGARRCYCAKEAAEDLGFEVMQLYVDGLWVKQAGEGQPGDYDALLEEIHARSGLPIALDGIYRWVVFLPSRVNARRPVANRYFGVFRDGEIKVRGIAARRHDTPAFIARVQTRAARAPGARARAGGGPAGGQPFWQRRLAELRAQRPAGACSASCWCPSA